MLITHLIHALPLQERRGLNLKEAASYAGISPGYFEKLVRSGLMPHAMPFPGVRRWDRHDIDQALDAISNRSGKSRQTADLVRWRSSRGAH
jgi:excisionase family DNA binding protein